METRPCPRDLVPPVGRRGFALPLALVILVVIGLIGAASTFMTTGDMQVSTLFSSSNRVSAAAAGGLEHASVVYYERAKEWNPPDGDVEDFILDGDWPVTGTLDEHDYTVAITRDSFDYDGDTQIDPVSCDDGGGADPQSCTLNDSDEGWPVFVLESTATRGSWKSTQRLRVTSLANGNKILRLAWQAD